MKSSYCLWKKLMQHSNESACALVGICVLMLFVLSGPAAISQELLKDVNPDGLYSDGVEYGEAVDRDGILFFVSHRELWRTNGTTQGTVKLREFENILYLTNVAGVIYFLVIDNAQGKFQLWKSNGASYNTIKVTDIGTYSDSIWPSNFLAVGNRLFFVGAGGVSGQELWTSDGTAAGTRMVKDIMPKGGSSNPSNMAASNGLVFFSANDGINGYELWKSDGTPEGTVMVKDIRPGSRLSSSPKLITDVNGVVFFTATDGVSGTELWKSDGTAAGTTMVKEIIAGSGNTPIHNLTNVNGTLFFSAADGIHGEELWKSNGTASGTSMVKDLYPGKIGSTSYRPTRNFTNLNGVLYFTANSSREDYSFWKSDGTEAGTINLGPSDGPGYGIINPNYVYMNGYTYFFNGANSGQAYRANLMREDGQGNVSIVTTVLLSDSYFDNAPMLVKSKNVLYFVGKPSFPETHALYKTNGTAAGTQMVADTYRPFRPNDFVKIGSTMYFTARASRSESLWKTDGTSEGTSLVASGLRYIDETVPLDGVIYFTGGVQKPDGFFWDIYRSDGTPAGTVPLNFKGGKNTQPIQKLTIAQGKIFFVNNYSDLWSFNGAFTLLTEISYPNKLSACGSKLYFYSANTLNGSELWSSDGTLAGTGIVKDINPNGSSAIDKLTCLNTTLFFSANDGVHGQELWRSNGTASGTLMVKDLRQSDAATNDIGDVLANNGLIYFTSKNTATSFSLWKSNGTEGGTTPLGNVGVPMRLMDGLQRVYFVSNDNGVYHFWKSEGTPATTQILHTFNENPYASNEPTSTTVNNVFYGGFTLNLFVSDGTTCGTNSYYMFVGPGPYPLSNLGETLLFGGTDTFVGHEVFTAGSSYFDPGCNVSTKTSSQTTVMGENELVSLYPNPFQDYLSVYLKGNSQSDNYSVKITDINGRQIESHEKLEYNIPNQIGSTVPAGMYLLVIDEHGKKTVRKMIKD